ncbi:hypothetical protein GCM10025864_44920 [Luteimicrobium album]|uniref:Uncharacterized protein n=1 Tax=Luteimicrobium album TaxID=1054550 RepID=A0ABQ6I9A5_9MICO|nr:hypothetical protein [Luteimicrobium album]GMA22266.1 hypothetical protein GCM10025864_00250 [Luteimicrobium album]GMA26671.1 hypothetical protein GCM10025864_44300 [Luteimicrobium album]GMA26733.1 hypothetical protein GCM10025864_44920 [Luteimicrobium album]
MTALFDLEPDDLDAAATSEPAWVTAFTTTHGATPTLASGRALPRPCPRCARWTVVGLDAPRCAGLARCDPHPLTPQLEAAAVILDTPTWQLWTFAGRHELTPRHEPHVPPLARLAPADHVVVLAAHVCGRPPLSRAPLRLRTTRTADPMHGEPPY